MATDRSSRQPGPDLTGAWRLESCVARDAKGHARFPLGEQVAGQLIYAAGGQMSAHVARADRRRFVEADAARGTDAEVREAFEGYTGYFGRYTVDPGQQTVRHHVQGASFPNWVATDQVRRYRLEGNRLALSATITVGGEALEFVLTWHRLS